MQAMVEEDAHLSANEQRRLDRMLVSSQSPGRKRRTLTLYRDADSEIERRFVLPSLTPNDSSILLDSTGELYILIWHQARIGREHVIFGRTQPGRDYFLNPPRTKTLLRLVPHRFPLGVDVTLRGINEVRDRYRLDEGTRGIEAHQMVDALSRLREVLVERGRFKELSAQDLVSLVDQNSAFLEEAGLTRPKNPEKRKISEHFSKGFYDSKGRKSNIAAISRTFALEYAIRRRLEGAFPPILTKFAAISEVLAFERDLTRLHLQAATEIMERSLQQPIFSNPQFGEQPTNIVSRAALDMRWQLEGIAVRLLRSIRVRPYLAKARRAAINLGVHRIDSDEGWENYRQRRQRIGIPTVADYLRRGDFADAAMIVDRTRNMLLKVLETYEDYQSVKKEYYKYHPKPPLTRLPKEVNTS